MSIDPEYTLYIRQRMRHIRSRMHHAAADELASEEIRQERYLAHEQEHYNNVSSLRMHVGADPSSTICELHPRSLQLQLQHSHAQVDAHP